MIDAPLYENTPWERLGPIAPWVGLAGLVMGMLLRRGIGRGAGASGAADRFGPAPVLSAALITVGLPFALLWSRAHDTYPHAFGRVIVVVGAALGVQAVIVGAAHRRDRRGRWALAYGLLTTTTCAAVAVAAFSRRIIAEGQVTAMVVAIGFLIAGVIASLVDATILAAGQRNDVVRRACSLLTLAGLSTLVAWELPIVQFFDRTRVDAIHPIHGSLFAFLAGFVAGSFARVMSRRWGASAVAVAFVTAALAGYLLQSWFGAAMAALGISVALVLSATPDHGDA